MQSSKPLWIALSVLTSALTMYGLYRLSYKINHSPNHFIRVFRPHAIQMVKPFNLKYNSYYFAGATDSTVYLGNFTLPFYMLAVDSALATATTLHIKLDEKRYPDLRSSNIIAAFPDFYITQGSLPIILKGDFKTMTVQRYAYDSLYFTLCVPAGSNAFAIRTSRLRSREYSLAKLQDRPPYFFFKSNTLTNQADGLFSTDGMMIYNRQLNRIIYTYYYRNQFLCMDTGLNVLVRGRTIDTTSWAKIKTTGTDANQIISLASPPLVVNRAIATARNRLFINSALLADNEQKEEFEKAAVIDVYNLTTGQYKWSVYLFDHGHYRMKDFIICGNQILALQGPWLVAYKLDPRVFDD